MIRSSARAVLAAIASVALLGATASPGLAGHGSHHGDDVVNLGDSFSAGIGSGAISAAEFDPGCLQGDGPDHIEKLTSRRRADLLLNAACGGLTTGQIEAVATTEAVSAALRKADVLTLTLGGNDLEYGTKIAACSWQGEASACDAALAALPDEIAQVEDSARATLEAIDDRTRATIVVLGYPRLFEPGDNDLLSAQRVSQINHYTDRLNGALKAAARAEHVTFVDVTRRFSGHGIGSARPWINLDATEPAEPNNLHPNESGYLKGYYPALRSALSGEGHHCRVH